MYVLLIVSATFCGPRVAAILEVECLEATGGVGAPPSSEWPWMVRVPPISRLLRDLLQGVRPSIPSDAMSLTRSMIRQYWVVDPARCPTVQALGAKVRRREATVQAGRGRDHLVPGGDC
jgi:hypothetical protein